MRYLLIIMVIASLLLSACSSQPTKSDDKEIGEESIQEAWKDFRDGKYANAEKKFNNIIKSTEPEVFLVGYYGLGWTNIKLRKFQNAKNDFIKFFSLDEEGVYRPSGYGSTAIEDSIFRNVRAGQMIALNALGEHNNAINTVGTLFERPGNIITNWFFSHDPAIETLDMRLLKAISHFALGGQNNLQSSLNLVKMIDPLFEADITTSEGRLLLCKKLEDLALERM